MTLPSSWLPGDPHSMPDRALRSTMGTHYIEQNLEPLKPRTNGGALSFRDVQQRKFEFVIIG